MLKNEINESYKLLCEVKEEIQSYVKAIKEVEKTVQNITKQNPFVISFVGRFKTGKSSLINTLLGVNLLPTRATTATAIVTRIVYGRVGRAKFTEKGKERIITIEEAKDIILNYKSKDINNAAEVIFELPIPWLYNCIELRDTPGMDDSAQDGVLEKIALKALDDTDLCICVYDAGAMFSAKEKERTLHINEMLGGNTVFAVNCTNHLNSTERLNEVENLAENFFGKLKHSPNVPNTIGKHFMMCTAPGMTYLDGFDVSLKKLLTDSNYAARIAVRHTTSTCRLEAKKKEISERAKCRMAKLEELEKKLEESHNEIIGEKQRPILKSGNDDAAKIKSMEAAAVSKLIKTVGLEEELKNCKKENNWEENYSQKSKEATEKLLRSNFNSICKMQENKWFRETDNIFIKKSLNKLTFPGTYITYTNTREFTDIALGVLGIAAFIFGGSRAGMPAASRMINGTDIRNDQSVSNTITFVETQVMPMMRQDFHTQVNEKAKAVKNDAEKKAKECISGLEGIIKETKQCKQILKDEYILSKK